MKMTLLKCSLFTAISAVIMSLSSSPATAGSIEKENRGIYILDNSTGTYRDGNIRNYDFVEGFVWRYSWDLLQPRSGTDPNPYDFTPVDHIIQAVEANGLKLTMYILEPEPQYLRDALGQDKWYDSELSGYRPVPWSAPTLTALEAFAAALANHQVYSTTLGATVALKDHPSLKTVSFGLMGAKKWIRDPASGSMPAKIKDMYQFTQASLNSAVLRNLHAVTDNFPNKVCSIGFWKLASNTSNPDYVWESVRSAILAEFNPPATAYPKVGFFQEDLAAHRDTPTGPVIGTPASDFAAPEFESKDVTFNSFQMLQSWIHPFSDATKTQYTVPSDAVQYALNTYNSKYAEIYGIDIDTAHCDPTWDPALLTWNDVLATDFHDNFENGTATQWTPSGGTWAVTTSQTTYSECNPAGTVNQKVYTQSNATAARPYAIAGSTAWNDYTLQAQVTPLSLGSSGTVGICARNVDVNNKYYFQYNKAQARLRIVRYVNGNSTVLSFKPFTINENTKYIFKADVKGSTLDFYVDGVKQLTASDTTLTTGQIALATTNASASFDNVKVVLH